MPGMQVPAMSFDGPMWEEMRSGISAGRPRLPAVPVPFAAGGVTGVSGHAN